MKSPLSRVSTSQLRILLARKVQPDSPHPFAERGFKLLSPSNIQGEAAAFRHFPNLPIISEGQRVRQLRFHVLFEKLAMPALPEHKVHIDTLPAGTPAAIAQPFAAAMGRRKRRAAFAADLASVTLPNRRSPFPAHEGIITPISLFVRQRVRAAHLIFTDRHSLGTAGAGLRHQVVCGCRAKPCSLPARKG